MYAPLRRHLKRPGAAVAVLGVGGLGHLAVQFAVRVGLAGGDWIVCVLGCLCVGQRQGETAPHPKQPILPPLRTATLHI